MSRYTIDDFWKLRLPVSIISTASPINGWSFEQTGLPTFREAPISLNIDFSSENDTDKCKIILVSAPGAVGKSTLAKQIAFRTGSVYVDLSKADPVGGNTISGGLVKSGLYPSWQSEATALLIDGLDEARLRVTQEAFEAFLNDIAEISKNRNIPTVLFGRTGSVQDAWLLLSSCDISLTILEIGYYGPEDSVAFAVARVEAIRSDRAHSAVELRAVELLLQKLREQTHSDGDRFAGYAPVLQAVAEQVAGEENPAALVARIEKGEQAVTLKNVVSAILLRERGKLRGLPFEDQALLDKLYSPEEQLDRLVARVYRLQQPDLPVMKPTDAQIYSTALQTWVAEHPFLDGGYGTSSAVFEAAIATRALRHSNSSGVAAQRELHRGAAANPFLSEFYLPEETSDDSVHLPPEHIGIIYSSLRARLSLGETASLLVEGPDDAEEDDEELLRAQVEITLVRKHLDRPRIIQFATEQAGILKLGNYIEDVDIFTSHTKIEIGSGPEAILVAPVNIQCDTLSITASKIVVECPTSIYDGSVFLESNNFDGMQVTSVPVLRGNVSLSVTWPGSQIHPWTSFSVAPTPVEDPRINEALRRFRKFVTAFRSHSKGSLARYQHKIEHERMTKGTGQAVLNHLINTEILSLIAPMYYLDPDKLGKIAGATYAECVSRRFSTRTIDFIAQALKS